MRSKTWMMKSECKLTALTLLILKMLGNNNKLVTTDMPPYNDCLWQGVRSVNSVNKKAKLLDDLSAITCKLEYHINMLVFGLLMLRNWIVDRRYLFLALSSTIFLLPDVICKWRTKVYIAWHISSSKILWSIFTLLLLKLIISWSCDCIWGIDNWSILVSTSKFL